MRKVVCGTPTQYCAGHLIYVNSGLRIDSTGTIKVHSSHRNAYRCYARYLVKILGFIRHSNREFSSPEGGPRWVLTKQSRFGGLLRGGKHGEAKAKRAMPRRGSGIVVS